MKHNIQIIFALILSLCLICAMAACGPDGDSNDRGNEIENAMTDNTGTTETESESESQTSHGGIQIESNPLDENSPQDTLDFDEFTDTNESEEVTEGEEVTEPETESETESETETTRMPSGDVVPDEGLQFGEIIPGTPVPRQ